MKTRVLCLSDYYLPGFKGGGPIRTLANMGTMLQEDIEFSIFTRDRDLGMVKPYPNIRTDEWISSGFGRVFYATPDTFSAKGLRNFVAVDEFDILYLNSFFSYRASISIYLDRRKSDRKVKILIAPRGEFSPGALALKRFKKRAFLTGIRLLGLYRDVHWHASSAIEAADIALTFPHAEGKIHIAADPVTMENDATPEPELPVKMAGKLKIAFISRISPKKNLDSLISILGGVRSRVELSIFGPIEDISYWEKCRSLIDALPPNITAIHRGVLNPNDVVPTFAEYDVFAFPTRGENFGHVIFEALRAGTPVLVSDQTPWTTSSCGAVTIIPLDAVVEWRRKIEEAADRQQEEHDSLRKAALEYAQHYLTDDRTRRDNLAIFHAVTSMNG